MELEYTKKKLSDFEINGFKLENYNDYDIVYYPEFNTGIGKHCFHIFKQPKNIDDYELAKIIDGVFYNVIRCGNTLECWYD